MLALVKVSGTARGPILLEYPRLNRPAKVHATNMIKTGDFSGLTFRAVRRNSERDSPMDFAWLRGLAIMACTVLR